MPPAPEHPIDLRYQPLRLVEKAPLTQFRIERNQQYDAERIGPGVAQPVGPYALRAQPIQPIENIRNVLASLHDNAHTPKG